MKITYDPRKRKSTLQDRALDFDDVVEVFAGIHLDQVDDRHEYGKVRIVTARHLRGRLVVVVWTPRNGGRHIISLRKANEREQARFARRISKRSLP